MKSRLRQTRTPSKEVRVIRLIAGIACVLAAAFGFAGAVLPDSSPSGAVKRSQRYPIHYGWVDHAMLSDFGPRDLDRPCNLLMRRDLAGATEAFHRDSVKHPDSLPDFMALGQCNKTWRNGTDRELRLALSKSPKDPQTQFRLGALEFYAWEDESDGPTLDMRRLVYAQSLVIPAWRQTREPIMGLLTEEMTWFFSPYKPNPPLGDIDGRLIRQLAGARADEMYQQARQHGWNAAPPPLAFTLRENLRPLRGVLRTMRSYSTGMFYRGKFVNGVAVMDKIGTPLVEGGQAQFKYLTAWNNEINQEEGD